VIHVPSLYVHRGEILIEGFTIGPFGCAMRPGFDPFRSGLVISSARQLGAPTRSNKDSAPVMM
jgi:hypothetical protein